jgi:transposase
MRVRRQFSNEFKLQAVQLMEQGDVSVAQVSRDLEVGETALRRWLKQFGQRPDGTRVTPDEHEELLRLRKENALLRMEREILKKAMGICVRELT